mgnify:CR=1 FL=1
MATSLTVDSESGRATLTMEVKQEDFSGLFETIEYERNFANLVELNHVNCSP